LKGVLGQMIRFDRKTLCWTDGKNYIHAREIRKYANAKFGTKSKRGKLSRKTIGDYFLDVFNVNDEVA
jgi:hypothetical protein